MRRNLDNTLGRTSLSIFFLLFTSMGLNAQGHLHHVGKKKAINGRATARAFGKMRGQERFFGQPGPIQEGGRTIWQYKLVVSEQEHKLSNGAAYKVWAYGGRVPGPTIVAREGDWVRILLVNETSVHHTIHSHGLFVPQRMDGVPHDHGTGSPHKHNEHHNHTATQTGKSAGVKPRPVQPGESFTYEYIARPAGTHWYHCHMNTNEHLNRGMAGALIVLPRTPEPHVDQDHIMLLQEWDSRYAAGGQPGNPRELNNYDFFTINGKSFPETETIHSELAEVIRVRIINAGSLSHSIHLHGHSFLVSHKDGMPLAEPLEMDTVGISPGERIDILVLTNNPGDWPLHCHTAAHQTNAGLYPGGMMTHLKVGKISSPSEGEGPIGPDIKTLRNLWRRSAHHRLGLKP